MESVGADPSDPAGRSFARDGADPDPVDTLVPGPLRCPVILNWRKTGSHMVVLRADTMLSEKWRLHAPLVLRIR